MVIRRRNSNKINPHDAVSPTIMKVLIIRDMCNLRFSN